MKQVTRCHGPRCAPRTQRRPRPSVIPLRVLVAAVAAAAILGCTSETPFDPAMVPGSYWLTHISGVVGPVTIRESAADPVCTRAGVSGSLRERLAGGSLELLETGTFHLTFERLLICTYGSEQESSITNTSATGQYEVRGKDIVLTPGAVNWSIMTARARGDGFRIETRIPADSLSRIYDFALLP